MNSYHEVLRFGEIVCFGILIVASSALLGQNNFGSSQGDVSEMYRLRNTDEVTVSVYEEEDLSTSQRIDGNGRIRMPLIGEIPVSGMSIREAEKTIEDAYTDQKILRFPQVTISVSGYAVRELSIFGQVGSPGQLAFPLEKESMSIVEAVGRVGGLTGIARGSSVLITRPQKGGEDLTITVDVEELISDKDDGNLDKQVLVYPGDIIFVPERLF